MMRFLPFNAFLDDFADSTLHSIPLRGAEARRISGFPGVTGQPDASGRVAVRQTVQQPKRAVKGVGAGD